VPSERLRLDVRGPVATRRPGIEEFYDLGHFRGEGVGPGDRVQDSLVAAGRHAAGDDEGLSYVANSVMRRIMFRSVASTTVQVTRTWASASPSAVTRA